MNAWHFMERVNGFVVLVRYKNRSMSVGNGELHLSLLNSGNQRPVCKRWWRIELWWSGRK